MKYASTHTINGVERVVVILPLSDVPAFDPENPPQEGTYGVPDEVQVGWIRNSDGTFNLPVKTQEDILKDKKKTRQLAVDNIVVVISTGKMFDGDETSQDRMVRAIQTVEILGLTETTWVLATNDTAIITLDELKEALALSMQKMGELWVKPYE